MITIKKTGEGYYLAFLSKMKEELDQSDCTLIMKELSVVVMPHRQITFNAKGIKSIKSGGVKIFHKLIELADTKKCKIRFINVEPDLSGIFSSITKKSNDDLKKVLVR